MKSALFLIPISAIFLFCNCASISFFETHKIPYDIIEEEDYLRGRFEPSTHPLFVNIAEFGIPCNGDLFLRREVAIALKEMYSAIKKDLPEVKFWVQSATRNWNAQKAIWEKKWEALSKTVKTKQEIASEILRFFSMPGTSRHHWGTDYDINILENEYYTNKDGAKLYKWLKKNAATFGFCQPYTAGRKDGHNEERWHWSYVPLAAQFQKRWNELFGSEPNKIIAEEQFSGADEIIHSAAMYVNAIDKKCCIQ
ncbi:MAG: M15 family metallopeptidase [Spirochaetes bacterium]|nr:M15 family metallopeptidase [Spirochaetota bacterium]